MTVLTLYALFGDDAKLCLADSTADDAFVVAAIMCIVFFGVEIVLQCFAYAWYFRGFYFWVDLASTLSILTEIPAVMAEVAILVGGSGGESAEMLKAGKVVEQCPFSRLVRPSRRAVSGAVASPDGVGLARRYRRGDDASRRRREPDRRHRGAAEQTRVASRVTRAGRPRRHQSHENNKNRPVSKDGARREIVPDDGRRRRATEGRLFVGALFRRQKVNRETDGTIDKHDAGHDFSFTLVVHRFVTK